MRFKFIKDTGLVYGMIDVSPDLAQEFITNGGVNRNWSKSIITKYGKSFTASTIIYQPLLFDTEMQMIDGQHRCRAVIESGITVRMAVIANIPSSAWDDIDGGKSRTLADVLSAMDEKNATVLASLISWYHQHETEEFHGLAACVSRQRGLEIFEKHKAGMREAATWAATHRGLSSVMSTSMAAYCRFKMAAVGDRLDDFWNKLETGVGMRAQSDPACLLRNRMLLENKGKTRLRKEIKLALIVKAINAEILGVKLLQLRLGAGEEYPRFVTETEKKHKAG